ncbi:MAG TPA: PAS domain-containing sensor histidine kinase [Xanthobacteraceae bacterium]|nr:PAS domain-containing sensor histidine kinase [Xanthobacteraceae bacterium]
MRSGAVGLFAPLRDYVETLVHPSAQQDALTAARHRAFIAPRLLGSIVLLASCPVYLLVRGAPSGIELLVFAWLVIPISTAYYLSGTGRYESAHVLSSLALTGVVTAVAAMTGGISSFAAIWLVVVPLEAALSASRRVVATASTLALAAAGLLVLLGSLDLLPPPDPSVPASLPALGIVSAALYATGLALGAEALARTSFWLLYAEEDRYRLLARNMTDVIIRHGRDGSVLFVSPAAETLFGTRMADLHGQGLFDRVHVADRPAYLTALGDAAALGESRSVEFRVRCEGFDAAGLPIAKFVWIEMRCRPLEQVAAEPLDEGRREVVAVLRDVTKRKTQEAALEDARAEAERANTAKTRFLATMSHELRTPLNAIIGFSEMLANEAMLILDAKRRAEYAGLINESGTHLLSVVNGVLDMSKIETGNFEITLEPFSPAQVIVSCCELLALKAQEAGLQLQKTVPADLPEMIADKRAFNQILLNLLSNAIRFTDRGGTVTVSARAEAAHVTLVVEDNGVGISDEDLERVGEPYFQAGTPYDRRHGGTGLGLSIVKGLVRLHAGEISIRSRIGDGTRITVRLPLDCERARQARKPAPRGAVSVMSDVTSQVASNVATYPQSPVVLRDVPVSLAERRTKKSA